MKKQTVERFLEELGKRVDFPVRIYLLGGAARLLRDQFRPTQDVDFEVRISDFRSGAENPWPRLHAAIQQAAQIAGITPHYSEEVDRWGAIRLPRHRRTAQPYGKFGSVRAYLLDPAHWAIGKLDRFLPSDIEDLKAVLRKEKPDPFRLVETWGEALGSSPPSLAQVQFRRQVVRFLTRHGPDIWGNRPSAGRLTERFLASAQRAARKRRRGRR